MKKRIGIIGLGDIAQKVYLPLLAADEQVEIVGLSSRTSATVARVADQYRIGGRFDSLEGLLEAKPDAVFIHSPTETHYELVMECLNHGVSVYVDKPLSYRLVESAAMVEFALKQEVLLAVGFNRRFAPMYLQSKAWLEEAGGFEQCTVTKHRTNLQKHSARHTLHDDLIHMLDLLLWLGGDRHEILHYAQQTDEAGRLLMGTGSLAFTNEDQSDGSRYGQFSMVRRAGSDMEKLELHGSFRSAEVVNMDSAILSASSASPQISSFGSWDGVLHRRGFAGIVEHFLHSLDQPAACSVSAEHVIAVHELADRL
ncbi:gfo/Idh/MocA family oxidoreductase [Paenibacillus sp. LMG 31456]|uniref:Gfo/Idh/MocA family oxidoreductase n=1 Tax=Paenibacillus foliorum TaxID=2654974 RepID=A0A972K3W0_9BACL|nr:Gfo/Idh/MocA family oxidoreductase [Paenibacillus foliorum]NOU96323.1 gfo/Idh/MocA family oxidoreductase [Paenibacillus foliorum]